MLGKKNQKNKKQERHRKLDWKDKTVTLITGRMAMKKIWPTPLTEIKPNFKNIGLKKTSN